MAKIDANFIKYFFSIYNAKSHLLFCMSWAECFANISSISTILHFWTMSFITAYHQLSS